jgi:CTP:molybdopterin cytidylyltransferase MocA
LKPPASSAPVILLLAAGEGRRFGGAKQLADIAGEPMVRRVARTLTTIGAPVLVVTGAYADEVEAALADLPVSIVRCDEWRSGMGQSLAKGVRAMQRMYPDASAVLVCLADQPLLDAALLYDMLARHARSPDRLLAAHHQGTQGPPALFPDWCFDSLAALSGPQGARALLEREAAQVELFTSTSLVDVDTPEALQHVLATLASPGKASP